MDCCVLSLPVFRLFLWFPGSKQTKNLPGKNPSSVLEPGARDTKFRFSVSILFFKTFLGEGKLTPKLRAELPELVRRRRAPPSKVSRAIADCCLR